MHSYDYTVIRVVPRVERGEFVNAGVIVYSQSARYLAAAFALDEPRLRALDAHVDLDLVRAQLQAIERICAGDPAAGRIGALPINARFHWLSAHRSALIQPAPVHAGRCADPAAALGYLLKAMVLSPDATAPRPDRSGVSARAIDVPD